MSNPIQLSNLTYADILIDVNSQLQADSRFNGSLINAPVFQELLKYFAGMVDVNTYALQRRSEECFFDTAQLKSSIISLARMFGYDISRPKPGSGNISVKFKGIAALGLPISSYIQIPRFSPFTYNGLPYVLKDTVTFAVKDLITADEVTMLVDYYGKDITLVQGEIKEYVIPAISNNQLGTTFQIYKIDDLEFSNVYSIHDDFIGHITRVWVGSDKNSNTEYTIDRRSLISWQAISNASSDISSNGQASRTCVIKTTPDDNVELLFGDDLFAAKGAVSATDDITVQYLSTKGDLGNGIGIVGNKVTYSGEIFATTGVPVARNVSFEFATNVTGGTAIEDKESIRYGAPSIFNSLDRLVTNEDYENYLISLNSPIDIRNAISWGEQEQKGSAFADPKSFNIGFFSAAGSLYDFDGAIFAPKANLADATLDDYYDENKVQAQSFFNVYTRNARAKQVNTYYVDESTRTYVQESNVVSKDTIATATNNFGKVTITYTSPDVDKANNISLSTDINLLYKGNSTIESFIIEFPNMIAAALTNVIDDRVPNGNSNYGHKAFPVIAPEDITVVKTINDGYDITIAFNNSPCYISAFVGNVGIDALKLSLNINSTSKSSKKNVTSKVTDVVSTLNKKSTKTIANVYVSPIIHKFYATGTAYIKNLFSIDQVKKEICNAVYTQLDIEASFGVPIYKSNIIQTFEEHSAVIHVDLDFSAGQDYSKSSSLELILNGHPAIQAIVNNVFGTYLAGTNSIPLTEDIFWNTLMVEFENEIVAGLKQNIFSQGTSDPKTSDIAFIFAPNYSAANRTYANLITADSVKAVYNDNNVPDYNYTMVDLINSIRTMLSYQIKSNLINKYGNIGFPNNMAKITVDDKMGSFTLGSEIVQLDLSQIVYTYGGA